VSPSQAERCIAEAAKLVNNDPGAAERLLVAHGPRPDGRCTGCGRSLTRWPCVVVMIARAAQELCVDRAGRRFIAREAFADTSSGAATVDIESFRADQAEATDHRS
jgi:hypothetical protein